MPLSREAERLEALATQIRNCVQCPWHAMSGGIADTTLSSYRNIGKKQSLACSARTSARFWGFLHNPPHVMLGMSRFISSTGSCQVRCLSLDVATILCIVTPHDREGPEAWPYARHEQDILAREDEKDQNGLVLAHDDDTLSNPGTYFFL